MMRFDVRALSADNVMSEWVLDAQDESDARRQIEARGLFAAAIEPVSATAFGFGWLDRAATRNLSLVLFSQELLALLGAGLGIVEALEGLLEKESNEALRSILRRLLDGLREGKKFSSVLAEQSDLFPALFVGIIRAAEGTGDLPRALSRYIEYRQRLDAVRNKIVSASIYPCILMLVGAGVSFFLIAYVVPHFAEVYRGAGRDLPWMSQLLLGWGRFSSSHATGLLLAIAACSAAAWFSIRRVMRGHQLAQWIARVPAIGERVRILELSRLYVTLGMLVEGGIPVVPAITLVDTVVSASVRNDLQNARILVESGTPLSAAFESNGLSTPISLRLLRVGERTGELGVMLTQSAAFYDGEISRWIDRFVRSFEPLLMAAIGVIVGAIVVALYMPIFDLAGSIS